MSACHQAGYRYYDDWQELGRAERAALVAHYFILKAVNNIVSDVQTDKIEKASKKGRGRR